MSLTFMKSKTMERVFADLSEILGEDRAKELLDVASRRFTSLAIPGNEFTISSGPRYERDALYDSVGLKRLQESYMNSKTMSPQDHLWRVAHNFADDAEHGARLYEYASRHWLSFASPLLSYKGGVDRHGLPISCYLVYVPDSIQGLIKSQAEVCSLSVMGGGVSVKLGIRRDVMNHAKCYDACMMSYRQTSRRGAFCLYLDIDHHEIEMFIEIRKPTGDENQRARNLHHAVVLSDAFMEKVVASINDPKADDSWDLFETKTNEETGIKNRTYVKTVSAKSLFMKIISTRVQTGEPFIMFSDTCNRNMNPWQHAKGLRIEQSNLCTEIIVPTNSERSSICCLSSFNLEYYDDFSADPVVYARFVEDTMRMLDNAITIFGNKVESNPYVQRMLGAVRGERNIGMGVMGLHSYMQKKGIVFDDVETAGPINEEIFKTLRTLADIANKKLGAERGEPSDIIGSGNRFAYTMAVAPTATSSVIMGNTSPGIEPFYANAFSQNTMSGIMDATKNRNLQALFESKGLHPNRIAKLWDIIVQDAGSVQRLGNAFLTPHEKAMYKTFHEMDQTALVELAAIRQKYIDQTQSLTLYFTANDDRIDDIVAAHILAWKRGCKTMYYLRSTKAARNLNLDDGSCKSCEA